MQNMKSLIFLLLITHSYIISCQVNELPEELNLTASELRETMAIDSNLIVLDVRTPEELVGEHGQIDGVINIPVQDLSERIEELKDLKDKSFAVICRSGNRSIRATQIMVKNGFNAKNVLGGMKAYNKL